MAEIPWGGEDFVTDPPEEERIRYYSRAEVDEAVAKERDAAFAAGVQAGREQAAYKCGECNEKLFWHDRWGVWVHDTDDADVDRRHAPVVRQGLARGDDQEEAGDRDD